MVTLPPLTSFILNTSAVLGWCSFLRDASKQRVSSFKNCRGSGTRTTQTQAPIATLKHCCKFPYQKTKNTAAIPIRVFPVKWKQVCCYAKASPYVLPKIGFIPPPYCQLMRNNGGLLPNLKRQTKLEVCHVVEYSLTAHHLRLFISRKHIALIGHFLHTHYKIAASKLTSLFSIANIDIIFLITKKNKK